MDPRLRAAVEASVAWYEDVFAAHEIPTRVDADLWSARGQPPRFHSAAKTLTPTVPDHPVLAAVEPFAHCSVADSFGSLDLSTGGFHELFEATWFHHPPLPARSAPPSGWSILNTARDLVAWNAAHDTTRVLPAGLLHHPRFTFLARRRGDLLTAGAVLHDSGAEVELSNVWSTTGDEPEPGELLGCIAALRPRRPVVGYAIAGVDRWVAAGFAALGPQVVWAR